MSTKVTSKVSSLLVDLPLKTMFAVIDKMIEIVERLVPDALVDELIFFIDECRRKLSTTGKIEALDEFVYRCDAKVSALEEVKKLIPTSETETRSTIDTKIDAFKLVSEIAKASSLKTHIVGDIKRKKPIRKKDLEPTAFLFPEVKEGKKETVDTKRSRTYVLGLPKSILTSLRKGHLPTEEIRVRMEETITTYKEMREKVSDNEKRIIDIKIQAYESILSQMGKKS